MTSRWTQNWDIIFYESINLNKNDGSVMGRDGFRPVSKPAVFREILYIARILHPCLALPKSTKVAFSNKSRILLLTQRPEIGESRIFKQKSHFEAKSGIL